MGMTLPYNISITQENGLIITYVRKNHLKNYGEVYMENILYRTLTVDECERINEMNPSQYIRKAWREVDGKRQLVEINFQDTDWPNGYQHHYSNLKSTILNGGIAFGAFDHKDKMLGFATIDRIFFGEETSVALLDQLFITLEERGRGIGKKLFMHCVEVAQKWNVDKIYICAGSAEETIAFYFAIGCKEAVEVNKELYESDPRDLQLEFLL